LSQVIAIHNNFIVGHDVKKKRFMDYGLWLLPPDKGNLLSSTGDTAPESHKELQSRRVSGQAFEKPPRVVAGSTRHPPEEAVSITVLLKGRDKFVSEEPLTFAISLLGVVAGVSYEFRIDVSDLASGGMIYSGQHTWNCLRTSFHEATTTSMSLPALFHPGRLIMEIRLSDRYPGLSDDDAFVSYTRRFLEFWSQGCQASLLWPPPPAGTGRQDASTCRDWSRVADQGVTLATTASIDRLWQLMTVAQHWDGAISAVLYARSQIEETAMERWVLRMSWWLAERKENITIVMVAACYSDPDHEQSYSFPVNMLRFHSIACATTQLVFFSDIDFVPSEGAADLILNEAKSTNFSAEDEILVIPCWKQAADSDGSFPPVASVSEDRLNADGCSDPGSGCKLRLALEHEPLRVSDLLPLVASGQLVVPGTNHGATQYSTWLQGAALRAQGSFEADYTFCYEPYIVFNKYTWRGLTEHGLFDRAFRSRGFDKSSLVYEIATLGYRFKVLYGVFLVHVASTSLCPSNVFGSDFCAVADSTNPGDWEQQHESTRRTFASFIMSLSERRAITGKGYTDMEQEGIAMCLIYPFVLFSALPITFVDMVLDQAFQAHDRTLSYFHEKLDAWNSTCQRQAADHSASYGSRCVSRMNWMTTQIWFDFSLSWCESVQALVGNVQIFENSVTFRVDARAWEPLRDMGNPSELYRHYVFGTNLHFPLQNRTVNQTQIELEAKVRLSDICTEVSNDDYYQRIWQCSILTTVEIGEKVIRRLERESLLVEDDFEEDDTTEVSSQLTTARPPNDGTQPRSHPPELLARVFLKTPCAPTCPAGRPIDLNASVSGLAPGVEYTIVYHVEVRRPCAAPSCPSVR